MRYNIEGITQKEWKTVKEGYTTWLEGIQIPRDVTATDIKTLNHQLDQIYTEARVNYTYLEFQYDKFLRMYKHAKETVYLSVKDQGKTEKERSALVYDYIEQYALPGMPKPLPELLEIIEERYLFFRGLIDIIKDKSSRLITDSSALKLESQLDSRN